MAPADRAPDTRSHSMDASVPRARHGAVNARLAAPLPGSDSEADDESDYRSPRRVSSWKSLHACKAWPCKFGKLDKNE